MVMLPVPALRGVYSASYTHLPSLVLDLDALIMVLVHGAVVSGIENLQGCPRLQRLWLCSNKITKMENLGCCGDLRELWLQVCDGGCCFLLSLLSLRLLLCGCAQCVLLLARRPWHCFPSPLGPARYQDNNIARVSGVEHLVNLQVLALGRNQISEFRDVQVGA
jgi:Leucine-rich repeat (LRR) protein